MSKSRLQPQAEIKGEKRIDASVYLVKGKCCWKANLGVKQLNKSVFGVLKAFLDIPLAAKLLIFNEHGGSHLRGRSNL